MICKASHSATGRYGASWRLGQSYSQLPRLHVILQFPMLFHAAEMTG